MPQSPQSQQVRVFISSTFRDMQVERDVLEPQMRDENDDTGPRVELLDGSNGFPEASGLAHGRRGGGGGAGGDAAG